MSGATDLVNPFFYSFGPFWETRQIQKKTVAMRAYLLIVKVHVTFLLIVKVHVKFLLIGKVHVTFV